MKDHRHVDIQMIPLDQITVVNPRQRTKKKFKQIVDSISRIGLKKPITVTPRPESHEGSTPYLLVCGQGRYEAFSLLRQTEIPAIVVNVSNEKLLLMSLVENLARRAPSSVELLREMQTLKSRGYTYDEIARKTDLNQVYVRGIIKLIERGEERLITAVERGRIPISVAVTIATSDDHAIQQALTDAYEANDLRGKRLIAARRIIEERRVEGKRGGRGLHQPGSPTLSSKALLRTYRQEADRQRTLIEKSKACEARLDFAVAAMSQLLQVQEFVYLLHAEQLDTLPAYLADALGQQEPQS